ncbi:MAG: N-acetylmuramoyl-L-alanine amidase [Acidobacteriota bacterium]
MKALAGRLLLVCSAAVLALSPALAQPATSVSSVSSVMTAEGPLFPLQPLVDQLGGTLTPGPDDQGFRLQLDEHTYIFGPESGSLVVDDEELVPLRPAPIGGSQGIQVPLAFLRATFGEVMGYRFGWIEAESRLVIEPRGSRELPVLVDVVNLQGLTTVVLQFPEAPRYRVEDSLGGPVLHLLDDRIAPTAWRFEDSDPLVRNIKIRDRRVELDISVDASYDTYTLESPFRVVFDVHPRSQRSATLPSNDLIEPPRPSAGLRTIVLDPGHGGGETGALGPSGTQEKDLTLLLARALKTRLESRLPVRVLLTRTEDTELAHDSRTALANQNKADLFISLHLNSVAGGKSAHGAETYFLSLQASDARAARSAEWENQGADAGSETPPPSDAGDPLYDLQLILWDLAQSEHLIESQRLAALIQEELNGALGLRDRGVKQAPFRVLMGAAMPAVLVELGFISNPEEERKLQDAGYRSQLVDAVTRAVVRFRAMIEGHSVDDEATEPTE